MAKLSLDELKTAVASYIDSSKLATTFSSTTNNIVGLLDKIGKMEIVDSNFFDKLQELDGDNLPFGRTIEEYFQDLILPIDYNQDEDGSRALKFYSPTYRPVSYNYSFGKKIIPESIPNNNIERAVNNAGESANIVALMSKRLSDSKTTFKYQCKREMIGKACDAIVGAYSNATAYVNATTDITEGTFYKQTISGTVHTAVCVKSKTHASGDTWAKNIAGGYLIELQMKKVLAKPTDESTGEAFIKAVKDVAEVGGDVSEGYSLNGNTIGAETGLKLYIKHGILSSLQVDTIAGAFQKEQLALNVDLKVIKDFGATTSKAYAIVIDPRAIKLHTDYDAVRNGGNPFGDFQQIIQHVEYTGFLSRNAFITIFVEE